MGAVREVARRLAARRVPREVADRRRRKLIAEARRGDGRAPGEERLARCDRATLVANVAAGALTAREVAVLYRAPADRALVQALDVAGTDRGIERLDRGATGGRPPVATVGAADAAPVALPGARGDPRCSSARAREAIRRHALMAAAAIGDPARLAVAIEGPGVVLQATVRRDERKKPSTLDLLDDPDLLEYPLTRCLWGLAPLDLATRTTSSTSSKCRTETVFLS
jgi:hypothetical protein